MTEKIYIEINGAKQGMFLQCENAENPVLLYLHGGPGSPDIAFNDKYPTGLEKLFTVCWWEQRGSCISYSSMIKPEEMTIEQMIADTVAVTNYLRNRFCQEKIYVMGHSWGSFLGVLTIERHPELYHAYIGVGQVVNQDRSERLAYTYMLEEFAKRNDKKMLKKLRKHPIDDGGEISMRYLSVRSIGMNKLGIGIIHNMISSFDCIKVVLGYKGYTLGEKFKFAKGSLFSLKRLWGNVLRTDLIKQVPDLQIPMYIFQGKYDYQVSYEIAREYAVALNAPLKGFYTFENSAHSPCFEEPEKMYDIMRMDVLNHQTSFADKIE